MFNVYLNILNKIMILYLLSHNSKNDHNECPFLHVLMESPYGIPTMLKFILT